MASGSDHSNRRDEEREQFTRVALWIGIGIGAAALGAAIGYAIFRTIAGARRQSDDPTSQRIAQLIEEANGLLKALEEQRDSA
jgi:alkylation response protein AidB-like acyl-CoA dehydrogenase